MSQRDVQRLAVLERVRDGVLTQVQAGLELGLSARHVRRLLTRYEEQGAQGLVHRLRGQRSNRRLDLTLTAQAQALIKTHYADFGPTLACEKLAERHGITLSIETVRRLMSEAGTWRPKQRRVKPIHPLRERRPCRGELIQIDGSPHDWFEGRAPRCTLLVFIDDATSELMALRFVAQETTRDYLAVLCDYILAHGLPTCLYSDRHSIFLTSQGGLARDTPHEPTRFTQVLERLGIEALHASSPQAKGRVERANQTLQDRLVKEMRLAGVHDMATANAWIEQFRQAHNRRFAVAPRSGHDAHVPYLGSRAQLDDACSVCYQRRLSHTLSCQFKRQFLQIHAPGRQRQLARQPVTILQHPDGTLRVLYGQEILAFRIGPQPGKAPVEPKQLNQTIETALLARARASSPKPNHPWKVWTGKEPNPMLHINR